LVARNGGELAVHPLAVRYPAGENLEGARCLEDGHPAAVERAAADGPRGT
jgi:hypothetical protein